MITAELRQLFTVLHQQSVRYLVIGGFAVNRYGYGRTTADLNLYIQESRENRQALIETFDAMGYGRFEELLTVPILPGYCEIMLDDGFYIDLMTEIPGLLQSRFDDYFANAQVDLVEGAEIRYLDYNSLLMNKRSTNRPKDQLDLLELQSINQRPTGQNE